MGHDGADFDTRVLGLELVDITHHGGTRRVGGRPEDEQVGLLGDGETVLHALLVAHAYLRGDAAYGQVAQVIGLLHGHLCHRLVAEAGVLLGQEDGLFEVVDAFGAGHGIAAFHAADHWVVEHETHTQRGAGAHALVLVALVDFLQNLVLAHAGGG